METQFISNNIHTNIRIPAINGNKLNQLSPHKYSKEIINKTNDAVLACTLSHIKAMLYTNFDIIMIVEDDIDLSIINKWDTNIDKLILEAPSDWEVLQLFTSNTNIINKLKQYKPSFMPYILDAWGAVCYIINKKGINKIKQTIINKEGLIHIPPNINFVSDFFIYQTCKSYIYTRPLFRTKMFKSEIHPNHAPVHKQANQIINNYFNNITDPII